MISTVPVAPSISNTENFSSQAEAFFNALVTLVQELNLFAEEINQLPFKMPCKVLYTDDNDIALTGQKTIDGYQTQTGDRVLVRFSQAQNRSKNGIWVANTTESWTRAEDFNTIFKAVGAIVPVLSGSKAGKIFIVYGIKATNILDTDPIFLHEFGGYS